MTNTSLSATFQFSLLSFDPFLIQSLDNVQVLLCPLRVLTTIFGVSQQDLFPFVLSKNIVFFLTGTLFRIYFLSKDG